MSPITSSIEMLEARRLLSSVELGGRGILRVIGDDGVNDNISVGRVGEQIHVNINDQQHHFDRADVRSIRIHGLGGDDVITVDEAGGPLGVRLYVNGGDGNDTITGGSESSALYGGAGDDVIQSTSGTNLLHGGEGNDTLIGGDGRDIIYGGPGNDDITAGAGNDFVRGGAGDDIIRAQSGNNILFGEAGNDVIIAGDGRDVLVGGSGDDHLEAAGGNNFFFALEGNNTVVGGSGNDRAFISKTGQHDVNLGAGDNVVRELDVRTMLRDLHTRFIRELSFLARHLRELR